MLAFKFLREGSVGPFSGFRWPMPTAAGRGEWVNAATRGRICVSGIHACDVDHLANWIGAELWVIELEGDIAVAAQKIVASGGRLVRRVESWDRRALDAFAAACVFRARDNVRSALRRAGHKEAAARLEAQTSVQATRDAADAWLRALELPARADIALEQAALAAGYLIDSVNYGAVDPSAGAFCAAHTGLTEGGYVRERAWQSGWIAGVHRLFDLVRS